MVKEFSTFGSCSSRNIFTDALNYGYKNFFHINFSLESVTLISLMSNPISFDSSLINSTKEYDNYCVFHDFTKTTFLDFIKNNNVDYLIIDTFFDVLYDIIVVDKNTFISDSERLMHTDLAKLYKDHTRINIVDNFDKFMDMWTTACDSFFKYVDSCDDIQVILNCSRPVYKYYSLSEKGIVSSSTLQNRVPIYHNYFRDILDTYILENYDVYVLPFDDSIVADENHVFGLHPTHYEPRYYKEKTKQINNIINLNENKIHSQEDNLKKRALFRKKLIHKFNENKFLEIQYKKNIGFYESIFKYLTSRIDIKNEGSESNSLRIVEISDKYASFSFPKWFCDGKGEGMSIHSKSGQLFFKIKCINDGSLFIRFMGVDMRDDEGKRLPIYIKFKDITINDEKINKHDEIVCHDKSIIYRKNVKNLEIITINATWVMF